MMMHKAKTTAYHPVKTVANAEARRAKSESTSGLQVSALGARHVTRSTQFTFYLCGYVDSYLREFLWCRTSRVLRRACKVGARRQ